MKKFTMLLIVVMSLLMAANVNAITVDISGTITSDSTGFVIPNHEVTIMADSSNPAGFFFYATRMTSMNGMYDCSIPNVPGGVVITFFVYTYDCMNIQHLQTVYSNNSPIVADFIICDGVPGCSAGFAFYPANDLYSFHFYDTSAPGGIIVSRVWSWGDGSPNGDGEEPFHTFPGPGTYTVCLTITNSTGCTDTYCETIAVTGPPAGCNAEFYAYPDSLGGQIAYTFINQSTGGYNQVLWNFGDPASGVNNTSSVLNPTHIFAANGLYTVCLTIFGDSCQDQTCNEIQVGEPPVECHAEFVSYADSNNYSLSWHFWSQSTGNFTTLTWDFGDPASGNNNTAHTQDPHHVFTAPGVYMVCLTISGDSCQDQVCHEIQVTGIPVNCENHIGYQANELTVAFSGGTNSTYPTVYTWIIGNPVNDTIIGQYVTYTFAEYGTYSIMLYTVDSTGCAWTRTIEITLVNPNIHELYGTISTGNSMIDHGHVQLWKSAEGVITLISTVEISDSVGFYVFGNVEEGNYYLKAELNPNSVYYNDYVPTYYEQAVNWAGASIITLGQPANPYNISLIPAGGIDLGSGTIEGQVTEGTKVNASGTPAPDVEVLLLDQAGSVLGYTTTDINGRFSFANIDFGTYKIYPEVIGKTTTPAVITLDAATQTASVEFSMTGSNIIYGINDNLPQNISSVSSIWPNPVRENGTITVNATSNLNLTFNIYDLTGQVVSTSTVKAIKGENNISLQTSRLASGCYYLRMITDDGGTLVRKFIVK